MGGTCGSVIKSGDRWRCGKEQRIVRILKERCLKEGRSKKGERKEEEGKGRGREKNTRDRDG